MKKLFIALILCLVLAFGYWYSPADSESTRTIKVTGETILTIPESMPDFHKFRGPMIFADKFANGDAVAILQGFNEDRTVFATVVIVEIKGKDSVIAVEIVYRESGKHEFYEDLTFMKTRQLSFRLTQTTTPTPGAALKLLLERMEI
jgi:hypothetical protein